jgi:hypothetical protein
MLVKSHERLILSRREIVQSGPEKEVKILGWRPPLQRNQIDGKRIDFVGKNLFCP